MEGRQGMQSRAEGEGEERTYEEWAGHDRRAVHGRKEGMVRTVRIDMASNQAAPSRQARKHQGQR